MVNSNLPFRNQLPPDYDPQTILIVMDGIEIVQIEAGQPLYETPQRYPSHYDPQVIEYFFDDTLVYRIQGNVVQLNRLQRLPSDDNLISDLQTYESRTQVVEDEDEPF